MQDLKGWAGLPLCAQLGCLQGGGGERALGRTQRGRRGRDAQGTKAGAVVVDAIILSRPLTKSSHTRPWSPLSCLDTVPMGFVPML